VAHSSGRAEPPSNFPFGGRLVSASFNSKPICADAAKHPEYAVKPPASIGIFSVKLGNDAVFVCDHANFAKLGSCDSGATVSDNIGLIAELPNVRGVPIVHLEGARRRTEFYYQRIDVLSYILLA
jgi:hypothetical protein